LRLVVTVFAEQPLCYPILDFAGVGKRGIGIEMYELSEPMHTGNVAVGHSRFDGVLVAMPPLIFFQGGAVEESFKSRRRSSTVNSPVLRLMDETLMLPAGSSESP